MPDNPYSAPKSELQGPVRSATEAGRPIPVVLMASAQIIGGILALNTVVHGLPSNFPHWLTYVALVSGFGNIGSAIALWRLHWLGPIIFVPLWLLPFGIGVVLTHSFDVFGADRWVLPRITFLITYGAIVFVYRHRFAPNNSFKPKPLRGSA